MTERKGKGDGGFTLVELIVVIAVLAILAGIAIPAYTGYIEKAKEAGDLQLLGAVNTAFAAACAEYGVNPTEINARAIMDADKKVTGISATAAVDGGMRNATSDQLNGSFVTYYGTNRNSAFRSIDQIGYDRTAGLFTATGGVIYYTTTLYGEEVTLAVNVEDVDDYNESTYAKLGSNAVLNQIDKVVDGAKATLAQMSNPNTYPQFNQGFVAWLKDNFGMTDAQISALSGEERANALVMMVASKAKDLDVGATIDLFNGNGSLDLQGMMEGGNATVDMATQMTVPFALAMAYVNSDYAGTINTGKQTWCYYDTEEEAIAAAQTMGVDPNTVSYNSRKNQYRFKTTGEMSAYDFFYNGATVEWESDPSGGMSQTISGTLNGANNLQNTNDVMDMVTIIASSEGFKQYMQSQQAVSDLEGFVAAMNMLDTNASNISTEDLLANGFGDDALQEMISSILGN